MLTAFLLWLLLYQTLALDCFRYSSGQYVSIDNCPTACQYRYSNTGILFFFMIFLFVAFLGKKLDGGCASSATTGCNSEGSATKCVCTSDRCNQQGYEMPE